MRNIQSITIEKAIVHVLDKNSDSPIFTDVEQEIDEDIHDFLIKHILKCLQDDENRKGRFRGGRNVVKDACKEIFKDNSEFVETSKKIGNRLFDIMKSNNSISSCDLVICIFASEDEKYIGVLKLDYQKTFIHEIEYLEDSFKVSIIPQDIGLPNMKQKLQKAVFIRVPDDKNDYDMIILDKQSYGDNSDVALFFVDDFLNSELIIDNRDKTKVLKKAVEKWTRKNLKDDFDSANNLREEINNSLLNENSLDIDRITEKVIEEENVKEKLKTDLKENGFEDNEPFEIDKEWVAKKMKKKIIKTDTGFDIKGEYDFFKDISKYEIKRNGDGTVDLIVKNVRYIMER